MAVDPDPKIIVALDVTSQKEALALAESLDPGLCRVKVGKALFTTAGPAVVRALHKLGFEVFLDLKFHDIPNTVAGAVAAAAKLQVWMLTVHASGGLAMLEAAVAAAEDNAKGDRRPLIVAVTVLTSLDADALHLIGCRDPEPVVQVERLANLAIGAGCDGVVCSAREAGVLRARFGEQPLLVTPGIRPKDAEPDDQRRTLTPAEAIEAGSNYLVIGRPVTQAHNPVRVLRTIRKQIR